MKEPMKIFIKAVKITAIVLIALSVLVFALRGSALPVEFGTEATRNLAAKSMRADRDITIHQLEGIVERDVDNPDKTAEVNTAMRLLGDLRADDAAPLLAAHLSFLGLDKHDRRLNNPFHPLGGRYIYPALDALLNIGMPSVDALLDQTANSDTHDRRAEDFTSDVLLSVLGKQPAVALVKDAISDAREAPQKQRLGALLVSLQKSTDTHRHRDQE